MSEYALIPRDEPFREPDPDLEERVYALENRLRVMEQAVAGWADQTEGVIEAADRLRAQLTVPEQRQTGGDAVTEDNIVVEPKPTAPAKPAGSSWLLLDLAADFRDTLRLTFDSGYKRSWSLSLLVPLLLTGLVLTWLFTVVPLIQPVLQLLMALVLFKVVGRELTRYRGHLDRYGLR